MNTIREIEQINQQELDRGIAGTSASWHSQFANSAWCYLGNLDHELTEGDILCIMSQYGEVEDIHLVREEDTGKSRGFAFLKYEDVMSCILAVDNFCGVLVLGRSIRVDHVEQYRLPKKLQEQEESKTGGQINDDDAGHAYKGMELENKYNVHQGMDLFAPPPPPSVKDDKHENNKPRKDKNKSNSDEKVEKMKRKEERQRKREEKEERKQSRDERREKHEEKRRRKRSRRHHDHRDDNAKDNDYSDDEGENKDGDQNRKEVIKASIDNNDTERKERKRHRSSRSHGHEKKKKHRSSSSISRREK